MDSSTSFSVHMADISLRHFHLHCWSAQFLVLFDLDEMMRHLYEEKLLPALLSAISQGLFAWCCSWTLCGSFGIGCSTLWTPVSLLIGLVAPLTSFLIFLTISEGKTSATF